MPVAQRWHTQEPEHEEPRGPEGQGAVRECLVKLGDRLGVLWAEKAGGTLVWLY